MPSPFHIKVIEVIKKIPKGRVVSYGLIARMAGNPRAARQVVRTLHSSSEKEDLPWHRVVNAKGCISLPKGAGYEIQKGLLLEEGVEFGIDDKIDMKTYLWSDTDK